MDFEVKARNRELSSGLLRQRRNLLISSVAVFIFIALGFELTELRFLGNIAKVNNPHAVPILLFIAHSYFTLRYWQYYLEENPIPKVLEVLSKNVHEYESNLFGKRAKIKLNTLYPFEHVNFSYPRYDIISLTDAYEVIPDKSLNLFFKSVCVHAQVYSEDRSTVFSQVDTEYAFKSKYSSQKDWEIIDKTKSHWDERSSGVIIESWITCARIWFYWFKVKAALKYLFKQSYFTDYQLPLVLSFISVVFGLFSYLENII
ncbi:hypothetical protein ACPV4Z_17110 [Vibrio aestuarianus]|uniref:hypothetical protein n=1 Tax=Vibrio aestuarianus TaxID=28171 RepID=UPI004068C2AE